MDRLDASHDPALQSWVVEANHPQSPFPIQNLPLGVAHVGGDAHLVAAIGDSALDLNAACELSGVQADLRAALKQPSLNHLMSLGGDGRRRLRAQLIEWLRRDSPLAERLTPMLLPLAAIRLLLPAEIGDYSDFYASIHHATNVGSMFRPDNPLLPNYKYLPVGYHGRASSIVVSETPVRRPGGEIPAPGGDGSPPTWGPTRQLDYELEVGAFISAGNPLGTRIPIGQAEDHLFGLCLLNDWSARDIQRWEYQPLGPFLAKSFATSVSPWVVTLDALAPFRVPVPARPAGDPPVLPHLQGSDGFDIALEVYLESRPMREQGLEPLCLSRGNLRDLYWTPAQMIAHHTGNGCNLRPGDLIGTGTVSGEAKDSRGCLLELTWRGKEPLSLPSGESRTFLSDGDEVVFRGYCERAGFRRIGFGECRGQIIAAV